MSVQDTTKLAMVKGQALLVFVFTFGVFIGFLGSVLHPPGSQSVGTLATPRTQVCVDGTLPPAP